MMRLADETPDDIGGLVDIDNIERLWEARADEKGVLLCTVHVGGMDVIAPALKMHGQALHVMPTTRPTGACTTTSRRCAPATA